MQNKENHELSVTEQLMYITTRVECEKIDGSTCAATGFFCKLYVDEDYYIEVLVSNRHVLANIRKIVLHVTLADDKGNPTEEYKNYILQSQGLINNVLLHPDPNIDLAVLPVKRLLEDLSLQTKRKLYYKSISSNQIADLNSEEYDSFEEILMIGYPNGLWDDVNNRPIFRRGITATDPKANYKGAPEFLIDCACFEGSSGSPIFYVRKGIMVDKYGQISPLQGQKIALMGIQRATPVKNVYGDLAVVQQTAVKPVAKIQLPINLGYVIKAEKLKDFIPIYQKAFH